MPIHTPLLAAVLALSVVSGVAHAQEPAPAVDSMPLGMAIAIQGDQALANIRSDVAATISQSLGQLMADSLRMGRSAAISPVPSDAQSTDVLALAVER